MDSTPPTISRRRLLKRASVLGLGALAWTACGGGNEKLSATTLESTIEVDNAGTLVRGPGEPFVVRTELAQAQADREVGRRSLVVFHHLSDFRILDEESPLRAEWSDQCERPPTVTAFRPQETLSVQAAESLIAAANRVTRSTVTGRPVALAFHTGNAIDNSQFNELRWFLDVMDGKPVYPDSGAIGYQGVQTESPASAYGDLLERAQRPFTPEGLTYPWYAVVGNRDVLALGNFPRDERSEQFAVGAQKIMRLGPDALTEACASAETLLGPGSSSTIFNDPETAIRGVGSDPNRRLLSLQDWMSEHFNTGDAPGPVGHGFTPDAVTAGSAYYVTEHLGVAFIVLDSVNPGGFSAGSIGAAQFAWLEEQLIARSSAFSDALGAVVTTANPDRLIVIVSHHGVDAMANPFPGTDEAESRFRGAELETLLHRFPNVVLHIAGHSLQQRIVARPNVSGGGHWEVTTASALDHPMQGRLLEVADNGDGTISIFSTVYDSVAPLKPGDADDPTPEDGVNQRLLAGVARQLAAGDPQFDETAAGLGPSDRNAELIIAAPFDLKTLPTATSNVPDRLDPLE